MPPAFTDASLLEHVRKLPHARATYKQLVRELRLHGEKRDDLDVALDRLCDKGLLAELRSGHFVAVGENTEYVAGRLSIHRDGFGFLIPDAGKNDIFLPPSEAAKGMNGDRALVHITRIGREGRAEGEILRILRRAHMTVVGEFRIRKRGNFVVPSDERLQQWIVIPEGMELPARSHVHDGPRRSRAAHCQFERRSRRHDRECRNPGISRKWRTGGGPRDRAVGFSGRIRRRRRNHDPEAPPATRISARRLGAGARGAQATTALRDRESPGFSLTRDCHHRRRNGTRFR